MKRLCTLYTNPNLSCIKKLMDDLSLSQTNLSFWLTYIFFLNTLFDYFCKLLRANYCHLNVPSSYSNFRRQGGTGQGDRFLNKNGDTKNESLHREFLDSRYKVKAVSISKWWLGLKQVLARVFCSGKFPFETTTNHCELYRLSCLVGKSLQSK